MVISTLQLDLSYNFITYFQSKTCFWSGCTFVGGFFIIHHCMEQFFFSLPMANFKCSGQDYCAEPPLLQQCYYVMWPKALKNEKKIATSFMFHATSFCPRSMNQYDNATVWWKVNSLFFKCWTHDVFLFVVSLFSKGSDFQSAYVNFKVTLRDSNN